MARSLNPFLIRVSRWPRRIAALVCLLLAAASTLTPANGTAAHHPAPPANPIAAALHAGQVAIPVTVSSAKSASFVRPGDHVGVLAGADSSQDRASPALLADRLRVLAVTGGDALASDPPVIVVAADRDAALRLATLAARPAFVIVDESP